MRQDSQGSTKGRGKMYLPLFIIELSWKYGIPRGKVNLEYDIDKHAGETDTKMGPRQD